VKWLLDTNVVSENIRPYPNKSVVDWLARRSPDQTGISIVTMAELRVGAIATSHHERRLAISQWIENEIAVEFADRTLQLTSEVLIDWLQLGQRMAASGKTRAPADMLIAATARAHDLVVVSRNARDFAGTGVIVYDPWNSKTYQTDTLRC
jgi:toxin FitB